MRVMGLRNYKEGLGVWDLLMYGLRIRRYIYIYRVSRVQDLGFRVQGLGNEG